MVEAQAEGSYPRLNASLVQSGRFNSLIVSLVGKFQNDTSFLCCDGAPIRVSTEHLDQSLPQDAEMVVEIVAQVASENLVTVRCLVIDEDLRGHTRPNAVEICAI
jgi:D-ribose pyranose/furanose isomerase RbsD